MNKLYLVFALLLFVGQTVFSQTGIFYYKNVNEYFPNAQIVDMLDDEQGNLLIVCSNSDNNFRATTLSTISANTKGEFLSSKNFDHENLYNIVKILAVGKGVYSIYGNISVNKELNPITINIDDVQNVISTQNNKSVYSTSFSDVYALNNSNAIAAYTRKGKDNKYSIEISKIHTTNKKVAWMKQLNNIKNEEANDILVTQNEDVYVLGKSYDESLKDFNPILYKLAENGDIIWTKNLNVPINFNNQYITANKTGNIIYACGYTKSQTGSIESRVMQLDEFGKVEKTTTLHNFSINGILKISNGNFLLYGSTFYVNIQQVVTKGKYIIIDGDLNIISTYSLTKDDKPDCDLKGSHVTSSELLNACELSDDRIAIGGKVFMPINESEQYNQPLLIICSPDGTYK